MVSPPALGVQSPKASLVSASCFSRHDVGTPPCLGWTDDAPATTLTQEATSIDPCCDPREPQREHFLQLVGSQANGCAA